MNLAASVCPTCGHENGPGVKFCAECGTKLAPATPGREVRKLVTVLFADVTGSTALGERLDPETLRAVMARYFAMMKAVIERHGGTVEKFIGDAVMAVFGIPLVHEDDALRAVRAAAEIQVELGTLNAELLASRGIAIRFRTGLNTGEVVAGDPTADATIVTGDTVNTAARLEQAAPPGEILLGALTYRLVRDAVEVEPVEAIAAKGKAQPVAAFRLLGVTAGAAGHARRLDAPLVGRERELGRLDQAFRSAVDDRSCQLFTLLGTAGVGKSRLVAEFTAAVAPEARILRGRCLSYGEGITYWPVGEIVRSAAAIDEADMAEAARAKIRATFNGEREADILAARVAAAIGLSSDPAPQEELFWAIRKLLEHLARDQPLVVIVEDIHWAEPTLLDLLEHIADWSRDAPLLLLCPARPDLLDVRPGWGGGKLNATTVLLEPLGADATGRLIAALPGGTALPPPVVARIEAAAEGNPLYVEELLGMLVDEGRLTEARDGTWTAGADIGAVPIPPTISTLLAARLERLAPAERAVAERASVVGRVFEQAAVAELSDEAARPGVSRAVLALVKKELVRPERSELTSGEAFRFRHILIRDAAYEALPKAERANLHERFADWLGRTAGDRLTELEEILGHHLAEAHRYRTELGETGPDLDALAARAARHYLTSAQRAEDRDDESAARSLFDGASQLLPEGDAAQIEMLLGLARTALDADAAGRWLTAARNQTISSADELRISLWEIEVAAHTAGDDVVPSLVRRVENLASSELLEEFPRLGAEVSHTRSVLLWRAGRRDEADEAAARAEDYALRSGHSVIVGEVALSRIITAFGRATPIDEILVVADRRMREAFSPRFRAELQGFRGRAKAHSGDVSGGLEDLTAAIDKLGELGAVGLVDYYRIELGRAQKDAGTLTEAAKILVSVHQSLRARGDESLARIAASQAAHASARNGDVAAARRYVSAAEGDSHLPIRVARLLANAHLHKLADEYTQAISVIDEARGVLRGHEDALLLLADVELDHAAICRHFGRVQESLVAAGRAHDFAVAKGSNLLADAARALQAAASSPRATS